MEDRWDGWLDCAYQGIPVLETSTCLVIIFIFGNFIFTKMGGAQLSLAHCNAAWRGAVNVPETYENQLHVKV